ncbi:hypothetical protein OEZ85_011020 [Tetradesmus obliquus]|uniref:Altered inheritance of mitochondria protein 24, mitochondrial n=1 Tax=Tetradesmus obliquus TaxID=3088 RepID=A0ABY8TP08_TETOB|nr:hypothetical protein OEZ85_011020 [Tetradesmus obliquus]
MYVIPLLVALLVWLLIPVAGSIGWHVVTGAAVRFGVIQALEMAAKRYWLSPGLGIYDWRSPDSWKWFVTSLLVVHHATPHPLPPTSVHGDLSMSGKIMFPALKSEQTGALIEVADTGAPMDARHGIGVYPGRSLRMFAAAEGDIRLGFAQASGGFHDAVLVTKGGDVGLGLEPSARLHVGGDMLVNGSLGLGRYTLQATDKGLQVCRQGGSCQYLLAEEE